VPVFFSASRPDIHAAMMRQYELVEKVAAYDPKADEAMLNRAYVFSMRAHGAQKRESGDPYFSHPIEVAGILTDYRLDTATIVTALLHDTVEDQVATQDEIMDLFGPEICKLVGGVTKLSKLQLLNEETREAENFRRLVLAMSDDIRVLLVKLADRLHNMRTLHFLKKPERRRRIATETLEVYAPLAERIGMQQVKEDLEELSFRELNPDAFESVNKRLQYLRERSGELVPRITEELLETLTAAGVAGEAHGREKRPYSIWRKMQRSDVTFEQLSDIVAFRIVVGTVPECYQALGAVHARYPMVPGRFKDYISTPKPNNYRSIHTTVIGPQRQRIEVQIRTREMHEVAEYGVAAHWIYKQNVDGSEGLHYRWLKDLVDLIETAESPDDFLQATRLEMFQDRVFCFSPKGDVIALPAGATPVDFAYTVHTEIGDTCIGAKVNGRVVPLRHMLRNGDQVEVLRSKTAAPNPNWENFVVTARARAAIRRFTRQRRRDEFRRLGRAIAEKAFRETDHPFSDKAIEGALKVLKLRSVEEVYEALGQGHLTMRELVDRIFPGERRWTAFDALRGMLPQRFRRGAKKEESVPIRGLLANHAVNFAECCHPLPGDRIVGILTGGDGVLIHTIDCETLAKAGDDAERWLDVKWDRHAEEQGIYTGRIAATVSNEPGALSALSTSIAKNRGNISNLRITDRGPDYFVMQIDIEVADVKHLLDIIAALRATPLVNSVERLRG